MQDYVIVRINEKLIPEFQINYSAKTSSAKSSVISSWSQIKPSPTQELILILSSILVFSKVVKIPSKNEEVIKQSIPYTLEEYLSNELEDNHFAYKKLRENVFNVCVVAKDIVQKIILQLKNNQLNCKKLYSETFTLPASKETLSILGINDCFITNDNNSGTVLSANLIDRYIETSQATKVHLYSDKPPSIANDKIEYKQVDTALYQAKLLLDNSGVNLFQGQYNKSKEEQNKIKPWEKALGLAAILLISWLIINLYQLWNINNRIEEIKDKQQSLLVKLIPNASQSEKNDPYSAIQSRLKYAQTNKTNNNSNGFIRSLLYVGQTLTEHPQVKVASIRQRDNKLEIKIQSPNVSILNQFQASLEKTALARHVKTGTRESTKEGISSVITMEKL